MPASAPFIDAHVHIHDPSGLRDLTAAGIIAARDAGSLRNAAGGTVPRPGKQNVLIVSAGWALFKKDGYGSRLGRAVASREEIKAQIHAIKEAGADIIKIIASGLVSLKRPGEITPGGFAAGEMAFIVEESRRLGLSVMAHANGEAAIAACAEAGVRSIEHGFFMTEGALEALARSRIFWVPTVGALKRAADAGEASQEARLFIDGLIGSHLRMIGRAQAAGIPLALGTDYVLPGPHYTQAYEEELAYFEQAGIPRNEAIRIACEGGAKLLGLQVRS